MDHAEVTPPTGRAVRRLNRGVAKFTAEDRISLARRLDVLTRLEAAYREAGVILRTRSKL